MKKLTLSQTDKKLCGVCGGLAAYFELDSTIVRVIWIIVSLFTGIVLGVIAYLLCALLIPKNV
ncbi:MAG: PspC domain-containing protein [Verrucomicrobiae bacterium]|nr:PspC domain-containing protein [Verrucomicrobiae bacterium]